MDILAGISLTGITLSDRRRKTGGAPTPAPSQPTNGKGQQPTATSPAAPRPAKTPKLHFVLENWTPLDRLTYIGVQSCPQCSRTTRFIAGDLIRYSQNDKVAGERTIRTRAFSAADTRFSYLPRRFETLTAETCICPECLAVGETLDAILLSTRGVQIPLFV